METIETTFDTTIYKKDSKGKLRYLRVYNDGAEVIQESGIIGTDSPTVHKSTAKAKNVGKTNETTPEMQAMLEAAAKVETKMSTGYFTTVEEAESSEVILPMLAESYEKKKDKITFPCFAQPKLDGMRALGKSHTPMISRKGKEIDTMGHIQAELDLVQEGLSLDGELYAHGISFQENMKLIKKDRGDATKTVKYHVYDLVLPLIAFRERYKILADLVKNLTVERGCTNIELVPTYTINNEEDLKKLHGQFISQGYEGTIVRHSDSGYRINKRDVQLLKYKDFHDLACEVVDVVPSDKNPEQGVVHCKMSDDYVLNPGGTFGCGMKFSHVEREEILENKENYIGKTAELRFFEYTDDGLPRFPVCVGFREDK